MDLGALSVGPLLDQTTAEQWLAARRVRKMCMQHVCTGDPCQHRNHRRDLDYARHCLTMLGLTDVAKETREEEGDNRMNVPRQASS